MLKGAAIADNGYVDVDKIGQHDDALICRTNKTNCCRYSPNRAGHWYFPNGTRINDNTTNKNAGYTDYFYRNRGNRVVRLNSFNNPLERGKFGCKVPDDTTKIQTVYVNIGTSKFIVL